MTERDERTDDLKSLTTAIRSGKPETVRSLLARDPELDQGLDEQGIGMVLLALYHRQPAIAERIAESRERRGALLDLHEAAALGRRARLEELLGREPDSVGRRSADGFTPLHYACFFARPEAVRILVDHGAEIDLAAANPSRVRPLHSAAAAGSIEICRLLLDRGAEVDARQTGGFTPLMGAAAAGNRELVALLLERGADPAARSDQDKTPADLAAERGHAELAAALAD